MFFRLDAFNDTQSEIDISGIQLGKTIIASTAADTTPPVITPNLSGTLGNNGWYIGDVTVAWDVNDAESTITSKTGCDTATLSTDTAGQDLTCTATSTGGTASNSVTVKRDATPPSITCPADVTVVEGNPVELGTPTVSDLLDGSPTLSNNAPASFPLGTTPVVWTAVDDAGNSATCTQQVTVQSTPTQNTPPKARKDKAGTQRGVTVIINVVANDWDREGNLDPGSVVIVKGPHVGTATANGDGTVTYTPPVKFHGQVKFKYRVKDAAGAISNKAKVEVTVAR